MHTLDPNRAGSAAAIEAVFGVRASGDMPLIEREHNPSIVHLSYTVNRNDFIGYKLLKIKQYFGGS